MTEGIRNYCELSTLLYKEDGGISSIEEICQKYERLERRYNIENECDLKQQETLEEQCKLDQERCKRIIYQREAKEEKLIEEEKQKLKQWERESMIRKELIQEYRRRLETPYCSHKFTPSAFIQILKLLVKDIEKRLKVEDKKLSMKEIGKIENQIERLKVFLDNLKVYIRVYSDSTPFLYRPLFEDSFYLLKGSDIFFKKIEEDKVLNYNSVFYENYFFFASLGCTPVNVEYLDFVHTYRNNERRKLSIQLQIEKNKREIRDFDEKTEKILEDAKEAMKSKLDDVVKETKHKVEEVSAHMRHDTIQHLGIFATFLAFVTVSLGMIKVAETIQEYIIFCLSFTAALAFFVILIHRQRPRFMFQDLQRKDKRLCRRACDKVWLGLKDFIPFLILLFLIFYFVLINPDIFNKGKKEGNILENKNYEAVIHFK